MKARKFFSVGLLAMTLAVGLMLVGCASYSTRGGVQTPVGTLTAASIYASRQPIAEYSIILGLITSGYEVFLENTKGKEIDIISTTYFGLFTKIQAVERD